MNDAEGRIARLLENAALACILAVLVARVFVTETPFRVSQLNLIAPQGGPVSHKSPDELLRVTFAMVLLAGVGLWAFAQVLRRKFQPVGVVFAVLLLVFSAWTFAGALRAVDVRGALTGWFEQTTILLSALAMMHLVAGRKDRLGLVVVVLVALAGAMAAKAAAEVVWEIPHRIAAFGAEPENQLAHVGISPGTPQAKMFEHRINDPAAVGYFGLSNVFASLLIVLAASAGGLAVGKFVSARRSRRSAKPARGELHLPTLAAVIGIGLFVLSFVALFLTRSKGGIAAAVAAFVAAGLVMFRPGFFARHRRKFLAACAVVILAGICAVAGWGKIRGGLPGWSMQVRWEYWTGSVGIIKEKPVFGTGPGGFGDAYLRHRLPAAAESTKSPHNLIMDSACQYGLLGGAVYLTMLIWILIVMTGWHGQVEDLAVRISSTHTTANPTLRSGLTVPPDSSAGTNTQMVGWYIFLSLVVLIIRAVWVDSTAPALLMIEAVLPACIFAVCLLAAMWVGTSLDWSNAGGRYIRIAGAAGLAGFILHNLLTYTLWMPATATIFWVAAGALAGVAPSTGAKRRLWVLDGQVDKAPTSSAPLRSATLEGATPRYCLDRAMRIPVVVLVVIAIVSAGVWLWRPVFNRTQHVRAAQEALSHGRIATAIEEMKLAVEADPLDAFAPADLARLYGNGAEWSEAAKYAKKAWRISPTFSNARILARSLYHSGNHSRALEMASQAVELNPMNMWFRLEYAEMLFAAGRGDEALQQIHEIRRINRARPTISDLILTDEELKILDVMEKKIVRRRTGDG